MSKNYSEQLQDVAREYAASASPQYQLDELVKWAIETKRWQLSRQDAFKIARKHFADALRAAKDDDGIRTFIDAKVHQLRLWADRRDADWTLRQAFLNEQAHRVVKYRQAVVTMWEALNAERKKGEAQFTLVFNWENEEGDVA
jgi:hypothetical protein